MGRTHDAWHTFNRTRPKPKLVRLPIGKTCRTCKKKFKSKYTDGPFVLKHPDGKYSHIECES